MCDSLGRGVRHFVLEFQALTCHLQADGEADFSSDAYAP